MPNNVKIRIDALILFSTVLISLLIFAVQIQFSQIKEIFINVRSSLDKLEERVYILETEVVPKEFILNHELLLQKR